MAQRSSSRPATVAAGAAHAVEVSLDGIGAVARERTLADAMLAAVDAVAAASEAAVARGLVYRVTGDLEVGPVGGSMGQRRLLDHFLAEGDPAAPTTGVISGVHRVVQAPVEVDGIEVGRLDVFLFEPSDGGLEPVISSLADALALVARSEG